MQSTTDVTVGAPLTSRLVLHYGTPNESKIDPLKSTAFVIRCYNNRPFLSFDATTIDRFCHSMLQQSTVFVIRYYNNRPFLSFDATTIDCFSHSMVHRRLQMIDRRMIDHRCSPHRSIYDWSIDRRSSSIIDDRTIDRSTIVIDDRLIVRWRSIDHRSFHRSMMTVDWHRRIDSGGFWVVSYPDPTDVSIIAYMHV